MVDTAYHASLRFLPNCKALTHHCELYSRVGWPALATRRLCHWHTFIYKAILGLLPNCLCVFTMQKCAGQHSLHSQDFLMLAVPNGGQMGDARTEMGKRAFMNSAPLSWNVLQNDLKLRELIPLTAFKSKIKEMEAGSQKCKCFKINQVMKPLVVYIFCSNFILFFCL